MRPDSTIVDRAVQSRGSESRRRAGL